MHPDRGIGGAGAAGDESGAGAASHRTVSAGHEGSAAFLPAHHGFDSRAVMQGIKHREEAFSGHGKYAVATLGEEAVHQQAAAVNHRVFCHFRSLAAGGCTGNHHGCCNTRTNYRPETGSPPFTTFFWVVRW